MSNVEVVLEPLIHVRPGDRVILRCNRPDVTDAQLAEVREKVSALLEPDVTFLIVGPEWDVPAVIRSGGDERG